MKTISLLSFLYKVNTLQAVDYAVCDEELSNWLDLLLTDSEFVKHVNCGVLYVERQRLGSYKLIDGFNRVLSLSLLLHATCECYKQTSQKNTQAINTIRGKYLINDGCTKLKMNEHLQEIYDKIILGERLSGKEKKHPMFVFTHHVWAKIKEEQISASVIFKILKKLIVLIIEIDNVSQRDLYYSINKDKKHLDAILLMDNYAKELAAGESWDKFKGIFDFKKDDIIDFFVTFFTNKFDYKKINSVNLYEYFKNYVETMMQYTPASTVFKNLVHNAQLYYDLLNINISDNELRDSFIQIKIHNGEDTYPYLLEIYEDFVGGQIEKNTLIEILSTVDEYLKNRIQTPNNMDFNELIKYLNTFIAYK